jgi:uncharacterized protein (TIGR00255 family)
VTLRSMTGFGRAEGSRGSASWTWEARSVNGRHLDIRCRLPAGFAHLEAEARRLVDERCRRGQLDITLRLERGAGAAAYRLNEALASQLPDLLAELGRLSEAPPPRLDGLLRLPGLVELVEVRESADERGALEDDLRRTLAEAIDVLVAARAREGERTEAALHALLRELERLVGAAGAAAAAQPAALAARLREQVGALLGGGASPVPEERLVQEVALLVARSDVREELDRLRAHADEFAELIRAGSPVGRKLDFLCQELNREANTLCAKSQDLTLTRVGLEIKAVVEGIREQVQNVE